MNRGPLKDMVKNHSDIFRGFLAEDATIRYDYPLTAIKIYWQGHYTTTHVKSLRCKLSDPKVSEWIKKYEGWAAKALTEINK